MIRAGRDPDPERERQTCGPDPTGYAAHFDKEREAPGAFLAVTGGHGARRRRFMDQLTGDIRYLTGRALWETENLIACVPDEMWNRRYDGIPVWKYLYHMLYSMDRWFINPCDPDYRDPPFHKAGMADLNVIPEEGECLSREQLSGYFLSVKKKIGGYLSILTDGMLGECPEGCDMSRLRLIIGQHRHWHRHMGIVYGFVIEESGKWPYVLNMKGEYPEEPMPNYYP